MAPATADALVRRPPPEPPPSFARDFDKC